MPTKDIIELVRLASLVGTDAKNPEDNLVGHVNLMIEQALRTQREEIIAELKGMEPIYYCRFHPTDWFHTLGCDHEENGNLANESWRTLRDSLIKKLEE